MNERLYTVDEIAAILELHPRTVRRFIKEGKLTARKIGKQWRIPRSALDSLVEFDQTPPETNPPKRSAVAIKVSAVVDIPVSHQDEAWRISSSVLAVTNGKGPEYGEVRYDYLFLEAEKTARFMFWGDARFIGNMLVLLDGITREKRA
jgi:excisionase family DNA binding protein